MKFELNLARRYARAPRKSLARFTSFAAIVGIAAGVASLIVAQALARGFSDEMREKILANTAHVAVFASDDGKIQNWRVVKSAVEKLENVREVAPDAYASAIVVGADATSYAVLRVQTSKFKVQSQNQIEEQMLPNEISIGARLAEKLKLKTGDAAEILTLENQTSTKRNFLRAGKTFQTGLYEYDATWIRVAPETFARLTGVEEFAPTVLSVSVVDVYDAPQTASEIRASLGADYTVVDWREANQPLFAALSLERTVALLIISLIIFIAALNITTTLALLVNERKLDIAVLRTCGARSASLILIFLLEGLFLGLCGIFLGAVLGLLACFLGNRFKIVSLSAEVYALDSIRFHADFTSVLLIIFIALAVCLIATVYPASRASRVKPLENARNH